MFTSVYFFRWPATAAQGPPNVYPSYGNIKGAWAQGTLDDNQFIEVIVIDFDI